MSYINAYMWNQKKIGTDDTTFKAKAETQMRINVCVK